MPAGATPAKRKRLWYKALSRLRFLAAFAVLAVFLRVYTSSLLAWSDIRNALMNLQFSAALLTGGLGLAAVFDGLWAAGLSAVCLLAVSLLAAGLLGRWYCSVLCPFGTLQEAVWRVAGFLTVGRAKGADAQCAPLRMGFLSAGRRGGRYVSPWRFRGVVSVLAGIGFFFSVPWLFIPSDPISNFGRGVRGVYAVFTEGLGVGAPVWGMVAFFSFILALSALRGRRFCDWCPVGTLLGLCSRVSPVNMRLRKELCVSCGACERACPMGCLDARNKTLDGGRCVLCLSCAGNCAAGALEYRAGDGLEKEERRAFLRGGGWLSAVPGLLYLAGGVFASRRPEPHEAEEISSGAETRTLPVVLPPGALDVGAFFARCVGCQACAAACPAGIIRFDESFHPRLDYTRGYCQYNCTECSRVCPAHALRSLGADKRRTRIGLSELTRARCVVITLGQSCGACAEVCPTHALRMEPLNGTSLTAPVFDPIYCIGCGGCFNVCPADPRAFVVTGVTPQLLTPGIRAAAPEEDVPSPLGIDEDFPF